MFNYISTCVGPSVRPELGILGRLPWTSTDCKAEGLKVQTIMQSGVVNKLTKKSNAIWSWAGAQIFSLLVLGSWWVPHVNLVGIVGKQGSRQSMNKEKAVSWNACWRVRYCRIFVSFWQFKVLFSIFPLKSIIWIDFKMENHFVTWFRIRYNIWQPSLPL